MLKYFAVLIPIIGVAFLLPSSVYQRGLFLIIGLGLVILWSNRAARKGFAIEADLSRFRGFPGEELSLILKLSNSSRFPIFWCTIRQTFPAGIGAFCEQRVVSLRPKEKKELKMTVSGQRRGIFEIPQTKAILGDAVGIETVDMFFEFQKRMVIYPPIDPIFGLSLERHLPMGPFMKRFGLHEDPARLRGCRDYMPGDSLKRIHWPNMARTGHVQVKEWETTLNAEMGIFLNLREEDYPVGDWFALSELAIETAASLVWHLGNKGEQVGFYCNGKVTGETGQSDFVVDPKKGNRQEEKILTYLAGVTLNQCDEAETLFQKAHFLAAGSCVILITPMITPQMIKKAAYLRSIGFHPIFLHIPADNGLKPELELKRLHIPYFKIERGRDSRVIHLA